MSNQKYSSNKDSWRILLGILSDNLARNERRFELIQKLDREIQSSSNDPDKVFKIILEEGLKEVNADYGHIIIKSGNELEIKYSNQKNVIGNKLPIDNSLCGSVLANMKMQYIPNVSRTTDSKYYQIHEQTKSELAIPIQDFRGIKVFGILNLEWKKKTMLSDEDTKFVELLNGQLAIAMEQVKLWQGVRMVSELSAKLVENVKREDVYALILKQILDILDFNLGQILLVVKGDLVIVASSNHEDLNDVLDRGSSICGHYIFNEKGVTPLKINDLQASVYREKYKWILGKDNESIMGSEFVVPLIGRKNNTIGVINIEDPRINAFSEFDEFIIGIFGRIIASTIEASEVQETIKNMQSAKDFDLIFASLGHQSINFLHNFGGSVGNAKARLSEFRSHISHIDKQLPVFGEFSSVEFLNGVIDDLNSISQILNTFRDKLQPENISKDTKRIDLIIAIENAISRAKNKVENKKNVLIEFEFLKDTSIEKRRSIDSLLTEQFNEILDLLLNNAIEAILKNGNIKVSLRLEGLYTARINIQDTGTGMDEETKMRVFDFGFTTKTDGVNRKGEGIGLWLSKIYFQRYGAEIKVESILGVGTSFIIDIPIVILDKENA